MAQHKAQVIDLARFLGEEECKPRPFGAVRRRKNSTKLYVRFPYFGQIVDEATGLEDTPQNERKLRAFLDRVGETIQAGTFRYAEAFPGATIEKKELFTRLEGREFRLEPRELTFGEYADQWQETILARDPSRRPSWRGTPARASAGTTAPSSACTCGRASRRTRSTPSPAPWWFSW
jgi:integrase